VSVKDDDSYLKTVDDNDISLKISTHSDYDINKTEIKKLVANI